MSPSISLFTDSKTPYTTGDSNRETFLLLSALRSGASVGDAVSQALDKTKLEAEEQAALLRESFAHASQLGWLCSRPVEDEDSSIFVM